jgi:hypothetical protein
LEFLAQLVEKHPRLDNVQQRAFLEFVEIFTHRRLVCRVTKQAFVLINPAPPDVLRAPQPIDFVTENDQCGVERRGRIILQRCVERNGSISFSDDELSWMPRPQNEILTVKVDWMLNTY